MANRAYIALLGPDQRLRGLWPETDSPRRAVAQLVPAGPTAKSVGIWAVLDEQAASEIQWDLEEGDAYIALRRLHEAAYEWGPLALPESFRLRQSPVLIADSVSIGRWARVFDLARAKKFQRIRDNRSKRC